MSPLATFSSRAAPKLFETETDSITQRVQIYCVHLKGRKAIPLRPVLQLQTNGYRQEDFYRSSQRVAIRALLFFVRIAFFCGASSCPNTRGDRSPDFSDETEDSHADSEIVLLTLRMELLHADVFSTISHFFPAI